MTDLDGGELLSAFDFDLPADRIAQTPAAHRGDSRLMVVSRSGDGEPCDDRFASLPRWLRRGDCLVLNDVRVRRARLHGHLPAGGPVELLLLREVRAGVWECLARPRRRLRPGTTIALPGGAAARVLDDPGPRVVVSVDGCGDIETYLDRYGEVPLPPYIKRPAGPSAEDDERYQTVFARAPGAVAAPTAGLHFTPELLREIADGGIEVAWVTLFVGAATFLPVRSEHLDGVALEAEQASIPPQTAAALAATRERGGRVVAVGTTTVRALESRAAACGHPAAGEFWADAFLRRAADFRVVDAMVTNFHLPRSTLLVLVCAFAGRRRILAAYERAVRRGYRFYSYGDAMLIV